MTYMRELAVEYAKRWAYGRNPDYFDFSDIGGDCTSFASQCIYAGAGVMNFTPIYGWFYITANDRTPSWTGVNQLYRFLINNRGSGPQAREVPLSGLMDGDVVQLDFNGDGTFDHTPVIIDVGDNTPDTILLAAHSRDSNCRPLASYNFSRVRGIHIYNVGE